MVQQRYTLKCLDASYAAPSPYTAPAVQQEAIDQALMLLHQLHPVLQAILDAELRAKNKVISVSTGYPDPGSIEVSLARRFKGKYKTGSQVAYQLCKDPHYWYAGYTTREIPRHLLLC